MNRHVVGKSLFGFLFSAATLSMPQSGFAQIASPDCQNPEEKSGYASLPAPSRTGRAGTHFIGVVSCWEANLANNKLVYASDLYAQWSLEKLEVTDIEKDRDYDAESRPAILRIISGRNRSMLASVKIEIKDPDLDIVIPLATVGYEGRIGKGEAWVTHLMMGDQSQSFFRIGASTSAKATVMAKSTDDVEVKAAGTIINTLKGVLSIVSPGPLLTTLNRDQTRQAADAFDNALSSIWSDSIDEQIAVSRQLSEWYPSAGFVISLTLPSELRHKGDKQDTDSPRMFFRLRLSCPRLSIFDNRTACESNDGNWKEGPLAEPTAGYRSAMFKSELARLQNRLSAQQVLNFKLASGKGVRQHLTDQEWFIHFLQDARVDQGASVGEAADVAAPKGQNKKDPPRDFAVLCSTVVDSLYAVGLSSFDSRVGLWAIVTGSADFAGLRDKFEKDSTCRDYLPFEDWSYLPHSM